MINNNYVENQDLQNLHVKQQDLEDLTKCFILSQEFTDFQTQALDTCCVGVMLV